MGYALTGRAWNGVELHGTYVFHDRISALHYMRHLNIHERHTYPPQDRLRYYLRKV